MQQLALLHSKPKPEPIIQQLLPAKQLSGPKPKTLSQQAMMWQPNDQEGPGPCRSKDYPLWAQALYLQSNILSPHMHTPIIQAFPIQMESTTCLSRSPI
ncbi:hypothetical protein ACFXTN_028022 [Malus domestica]